MIIRCTLAVANLNEGFGATADPSGLMLKNPAPLPKLDPAYP
jgi:hypothetical protein